MARQVRPAEVQVYEYSIYLFYMNLFYFIWLNRCQKKTSPQLRGEAGFWSDVPVFRALRPW